MASRKPRTIPLPMLWVFLISRRNPICGRGKEKWFDVISGHYENIADAHSQATHVAPSICNTFLVMFSTKRARTRRLSTYRILRLVRGGKTRVALTGFWRSSQNSFAEVGSEGMRRVRAAGSILSNVPSLKTSTRCI